jgi:hypothetical protein
MFDERQEIRTTSACYTRERGPLSESWAQGGLIREDGSCPLPSWGFRAGDGTFSSTPVFFPLVNTSGLPCSDQFARLIVIDNNLRCLAARIDYEISLLRKREATFQIDQFTSRPIEPWKFSEEVDLKLRSLWRSILELDCSFSEDMNELLQTASQSKSDKTSQKSEAPTRGRSISPTEDWRRSHPKSDEIGLPVPGGIVSPNRDAQSVQVMAHVVEKRCQLRNDRVSNAFERIE